MLKLFEVISEPFRRKRRANLMKLIHAEMERSKKKSNVIRICPHANNGITELVVEGDYTVKMHYSVKRNTSQTLSAQKAMLQSNYKGFFYLRSNGKKIDFLADVTESDKFYKLQNLQVQSEMR